VPLGSLYFLVVYGFRLTIECCKQTWLVNTIYIESLQNRLLKVCYVPATSANLPRVNFFFSFFVAAAIDSTNEQGNLSSLYS
jgi:hypothetical protein